MKKLIIIGLLLTGIILSWLFFRKSATNSPRCSQSTMQEFYKNCLHKEEQRLWHELEQKYGIGYEECKKIAKGLPGNPPKENTVPISQPMQNLIKEVLDDFCKKTVIALGFTDSTAPALTDRSKVYVNEKFLASYSEKGKKYIIGHELGHQINDDPAMLTALEDSLNNKGIDASLSDLDINKMSRFYEIRADIETAIKSQEYAQGLIEAFEQLLKQNGGKDGPRTTHPKHSTRIKAGKAILAAHRKVNPASVQLS